VFDLSLRHTEQGKRVLDVVKKEMVEYVRRLLEGEDLFYLYHPQIFEPTENVGQMVSCIDNYETDGWVFDLGYALKQAFFIVAAEDEDMEKTIILITDRLQDTSPITKLLRLERRDQTGCRFVVVSIGQNCIDLSLDGLTCLHVDDPSSLCKLLEEVK
jgi:hypothetical protein